MALGLLLAPAAAHARHSHGRSPKGPVRTYTVTLKVKGSEKVHSALTTLDDSECRSGETVDVTAPFQYSEVFKNVHFGPFNGRYAIWGGGHLGLIRASKTRVGGTIIGSRVPDIGCGLPHVEQTCKVKLTHRGSSHRGGFKLSGGFRRKENAYELLIAAPMFTQVNQGPPLNDDPSGFDCPRELDLASDWMDLGVTHRFALAKARAGRAYRHSFDTTKEPSLGQKNLNFHLHISEVVGGQTSTLEDDVELAGSVSYTPR